jgi:hypothetical protein
MSVQRVSLTKKFHSTSFLSPKLIERPLISVIHNLVDSQQAMWNNSSRTAALTHFL